MVRIGLLKKIAYSFLFVIILFGVSFNIYADEDGTELGSEADEVVAGPDIGLVEETIDSIYEENVLNQDNYEEFLAFALSSIDSPCGDNLSGLDYSVYNAFKPVIQQIAAGNISNTKISISADTIGVGSYRWYGTDLGFETDDLSPEDFFTDGEIYEGNRLPSITSVLKTALPYNSYKVIFSLLRDCPSEFYWFSNFFAKNDPISTWWYEVDENGKPYVYINTDFKIHFKVSASYSETGAASYVLDRTKAESAVSAIANAQSIVDAASNMTDSQKLHYYAEQIIILTDYNHSPGDAEKNSNAYQIVWLFDNDPETKVVCEGYSKGFQYLCQLTEFDDPEIYCCSVDGKLYGTELLGNHMWNIIRMDDGRKYMIDLTNSDSGSVLSEDFYLANAVGGDAETGYVFLKGSTLYTFVYGTWNSAVNANQTTGLIYSADDLAITFEPYGHTIRHFEAVEPTYVTKGTIEYWYCEECGKYYSDAGCTAEIEPESLITDDYLIPEMVETVRAKASGDGIALSWNKTDGATKYRVYRSRTGTAGTYSKITDTAETSFCDTSATHGRVYYYIVRAYNNVSRKWGSYSYEAKTAGICLTTPTISSVKADETGTLIKWTNIRGASGYRVYRSTTGETGTFWKIADVTSNNYIDTTAKHGRTYYYIVRAFTTATGSRVWSGYDHEGTSFMYLTSPSVKSISSVSSGIKIKWNTIAGATEYVIYRSTIGEVGTYRKIATVAEKSYIDKTAVSGTEYYYIVRACNSTTERTFWSYRYPPAWKITR